MENGKVTIEEVEDLVAEGHEVYFSNGNLKVNWKKGVKDASD